jgi:hypothetical protein
MGTRKDPKQTQTQNTTTNYQGAFMSSPVTPEEQELKDYEYDETRLDAGTKSLFNRQREAAAESLAEVTNPYTKARMQQIMNEEIGAEESSALTAADRERNALKLQNKQFLAGLRRPQYIQTGAMSSGTGTATQQNQQSNLLASLISGGLGLAGAFA